jgi:hypothetical protein
MHDVKSISEPSTSIYEKNSIPWEARNILPPSSGSKKTPREHSARLHFLAGYLLRLVLAEEVVGYMPL